MGDDGALKGQMRIAYLLVGFGGGIWGGGWYRGAGVMRLEWNGMECWDGPCGEGWCVGCARLCYGVLWCVHCWALNMVERAKLRVVGGL